jgi:hypothetical protein
MSLDNQLRFTQATDSLDFAKEHHYTCHVVTLIDEKDDGMDKRFGWCSVINKALFGWQLFILNVPQPLGF